MKLRRVSLHRIGLVSVVLVAALSAGAEVTGMADPKSLLLGGGFMLADFHLIRLLVSRLIAPGMRQGWTVLLLMMKFLFVVVLIAGVMYQFPIEPMSFAAGASILLAAIVLDATVLGSVLEVEEASAADTP